MCARRRWLINYGSCYNSKFVAPTEYNTQRQLFIIVHNEDDVHTYTGGGTTDTIIDLFITWGRKERSRQIGKLYRQRSIDRGREHSFFFFGTHGDDSHNIIMPHQNYYLVTIRGLSSQPFSLSLSLSLSLMHVTKVYGAECGRNFPMQHHWFYHWS
jgi:hypothetical protein